MARLSDTIEDFIVALLKESDGMLELRRNELADYFSCAPSQINYVLATRFSIDRGYHIESQRGGGGYIRIIRVNMSENDYLLYLLTSRLGSRISEQGAKSILNRMQEDEIITSRENKLMFGAVRDNALPVSPNVKDAIRASIMRSMITGLLENEPLGGNK